jgi:hypothetical protein
LGNRACRAHFRSRNWRDKRPPPCPPIAIFRRRRGWHSYVRAEQEQQESQRKFHARPQNKLALERRLAVYGRRRRPLCLLDSAFLIANSSIVRPDLRAAVNHLGCFPRPDQASYGGFEFRYFGNTCGYWRWGRSSDARSVPRVFVSMRSRASRFSSSRFSDTKRADNI